MWYANILLHSQQPLLLSFAPAYIVCRIVSHSGAFSIKRVKLKTHPIHAFITLHQQSIYSIVWGEIKHDNQITTTAQIDVHSKEQNNDRSEKKRKIKGKQ